MRMSSNFAAGQQLDEVLFVHNLIELQESSASTSPGSESLTSQEVLISEDCPGGSGDDEPWVDGAVQCRPTPGPG